MSADVLEIVLVPIARSSLTRPIGVLLETAYCMAFIQREHLINEGTQEALKAALRRTANLPEEVAEDLGFRLPLSQ